MMSYFKSKSISSTQSRLSLLLHSLYTFYHHANRSTMYFTLFCMHAIFYYLLPVILLFLSSTVTGMTMVSILSSSSFLLWWGRWRLKRGLLAVLHRLLKNIHESKAFNQFRGRPQALLAWAGAWKKCLQVWPKYQFAKTQYGSQASSRRQLCHYRCERIIK